MVAAEGLGGKQVAVQLRAGHQQAGARLEREELLGAEVVQVGRATPVREEPVVAQESEGVAEQGERPGKAEPQGAPGQVAAAVRAVELRGKRVRAVRLGKEEQREQAAEQGERPGKAEPQGAPGQVGVGGV